MTDRLIDEIQAELQRGSVIQKSAESEQAIIIRDVIIQRPLDIVSKPINQHTVPSGNVGV